MKRRRHASAPAGMTLVELLLALSLTAMIGLCAAGLVGAGAQVWSEAGVGDAAVSDAERARAAVEAQVNAARAVARTSGGPHLLLWLPPPGTPAGELANGPLVKHLRLLHADAESAELQLWVARDESDVDREERRYLQSDFGDQFHEPGSPARITGGDLRDLFEPHRLAGGLRAGRFEAAPVGHVVGGVTVQYDLALAGGGSPVAGHLLRRDAEAVGE